MPPSEEQKDDKMAIKPGKTKVTIEKDFELVGASSGTKTLEKDYFDKVMS